MPDHPVENISLRNIQLHLENVFDPYPKGLTSTGRQFCPNTPNARAARAAVVVENARRFSMSGVEVFWPQNMPAHFEEFWSANITA
ncbi:MAG: hypothetical protein LR015_03085 [Verrucomicrobia bacterium]|nr:hypothetical protein [Verrucomicrobiota bacterium]